MSDTASSPNVPGSASRDELQTALFLDLVAQHANMAMIFLGRVPHPQTGKQVRDVETARLFIDQLEMLDAKTKGNLNKHEETLLKQSLMATRMAFVETIESPPADTTARSDESPAASAQPPGGSASPADAPSEGEAGPQPDATPEDKKKFVKKY
jgi:hypothetical protein